MTTTRSHEHTRRPSPLATVRRIIAQLRGDPRAVGLILVVPPLLLLLLHYVFVDTPTPPGQSGVFDTIGPIMMAVIPIRRWNLIASYALVFGLLAVAQSLLLVLLLLGPLDVSVQGPAWGFLLLSLLSAVIGVAFGLLASAFARTEFQAVQFMPIFIAPQVFLCGLLVPKEQMPEILGAITEWLPMTWAVDVVREMLEAPELSSDSWRRLTTLAATALLALVVAAWSMPRRTR